MKVVTSLALPVKLVGKSHLLRISINWELFSDHLREDLIAWRYCLSVDLNESHLCPSWEREHSTPTVFLLFFAQTPSLASVQTVKLFYKCSRHFRHGLVVAFGFIRT
jgi:hypothetical protein